MKDEPISTIEDLVLNDEEKDRLVKFFDVLIEMDFEDKRNNKGSEDNTNVLLNTTSSVSLAGKPTN